MSRKSSSLSAGVVAAFSLLTLSPRSLESLEYVEASNGLSFPQWGGGNTEIEMADVNLDGHLDLVSVGDHGSPDIGTEQHGTMVYFGDGTCRNWTVVMSGYFGYGGCCVGDVNGDGLPDVGYGIHHDYSENDFGDQLIEVALGDGTGQDWTPWDDKLANQGEKTGMFSCDFGDVDNDGDLDIASTSFGFGNPLMIYLNNGDGTWSHSAALSGGNCGMLVFFGDINRDGHLDVVTSYGNGSVFFGNGDGTFREGMYNLPTGGTFGLSGISMGDVDNDGGMDIAFVLDGRVRVWVFDETSTRWIDRTGNLPQAGGYSYTHLVDMNADGFCDVVAGGAGRVTVWTGDGTRNWTPAASYFIESDPSCSFKAFRLGGDADHNGYPDIVHLTYEVSTSTNRLRFYRESSVPQTLTVFPVFPRGGEVFRSGGVRFTDWLSAVPNQQASEVKVELSTTGPAGPWTVLGQDLPDNGRLQWSIPAVPTSSDCYLRYTVASAGDTVVAVTPRPFTIISRSFVRSDANCDGGADLSDAVSLLAHLFLGSQPPCCLDAADADDNGALEITDAIYSLSFLFLGGSVPPAPFPDCGTDSTIDGLDCAAYPECP